MFLILVFSLLFSDPCNDPYMYGYFSPDTGLYIKCPASRPITESYENTVDYYAQDDYGTPTPQSVYIDLSTPAPRSWCSWRNRLYGRCMFEKTDLYNAYRNSFWWRP